MNSFVCFLLAVTCSLASAADRQIVRLRLASPNEVERLADLELDFVSEARTRVRDVVVTDDELATIRQRGFPVEVVVPKDAEFAIPPEYHDYAETFHVFDSLQQLYPDILHIDTVGYTQWRSWPIHGVRISDNPSVEEDEPAILLVGVTHAREPMGSEIIIYLAKYLCSNYASSPAVKRWIDSTEIRLIPIVNVDGSQFMFDSATTYPYWRKNQRDNDNNGRFDRTYDGVDLNRNFDWRWTYGGSTNPPDQTYRGPSPGSETEVQAWCRLALRRKPVFGISYHSYGGVVMYTWRYQGQQTPDEDILSATAGRMAQLTGYTVEPTGGSNMSTDWLYARAGQLDFVIETYWDEFIPRAESILPTCRRNFNADTFLFNRLLYGGIRGRVTDSVTGNPVVAEVRVLGTVDTMLPARTTDSAFGRFHRALLPGTYGLRFTAPGYETLTVTGVGVSNSSLTYLEVRLRGHVGMAGPRSRGPETTSRATPNPFVSFASMPGAEVRGFEVFDVSGKLVQTCTGSRIGAGLGPGVYCVRPHGSSDAGQRLVKAR